MPSAGVTPGVVSRFLSTYAATAPDRACLLNSLAWQIHSLADSKRFMLSDQVSMLQSVLARRARAGSKPLRFCASVARRRFQA